MVITNHIGRLGEAIFNVEISRGYHFLPSPLGEKWPVSDFYVELLGPKEHLFFVVQVKSTTRKVSNKGRLRITAPKKKLKALNKYYCPTYLAGVEVKTDSVYLIAINTSKRKDINNLPTKFKLDANTRLKLFRDVRAFWKNSGLIGYKKKFKHSI